MRLRRINFFYFLVRTLACLCFQPFYRIKVEGRENIPPKGPFILLPKHQFWSDIPIVAFAARRPLNYLAKKGLFIYPGIRRFFIFLGGIPLDRCQPLKSLDSFRYVTELLKKGEGLVLFPEGTYYPHSMGPGKYRFIQYLLRLQEEMGWQGERAIAFIPVGIRYHNKIRKEVCIQIGHPLSWDVETKAQPFTFSLMKRIASLSGLSAES